MAIKYHHNLQQLMIKLIIVYSLFFEQLDVVSFAVLSQFTFISKEVNFPLRDYITEHETTISRNYVTRGGWHTTQERERVIVSVGVEENESLTIREEKREKRKAIFE